MLVERYVQRLADGSNEKKARILGRLRKQPGDRPLNRPGIAKSLWVIPCSCRFVATSNKKLSQFLSSSEFTNSSPVFCYRTLSPEEHDSFCAETATFVSTYWQCNLLQLNCTKYLLNLEGFLFDNNRQKRRSTNGLEHGVRAAYFTNDT